MIVKPGLARVRRLVFPEAEYTGRMDLFQALVEDPVLVFRPVGHGISCRDNKVRMIGIDLVHHGFVEDADGILYVSHHDE